MLRGERVLAVLFWHNTRMILTNSTDSTAYPLASKVQTLALTDKGLRMLDQTALPEHVRYVELTTAAEVAEAIRTMIVRGAPAIGIAGAYGVVLTVRQTTDMQTLRADAMMLRESRPTAVNLMWAIDAMLGLIQNTPEADLLKVLTNKAVEIHQQDLAACHKMGELGAGLMPKGARILTHCNAGALATAGYGTALGIVRSAFQRDPSVQVFADETRPRLQGAKLTTWELQQDGIPVTLICDGMGASLMRQGLIDCVIVGADRIAANGDTANKIGTFPLALAAHAHKIPFYVAAPCSTIDLSIPTGEAIPIELRDEAEIHSIGFERICPEGIAFYNPAFDVTPARYISAIITEAGIARPDYIPELAALFSP